MSMSQEQENFEQLRRLLALKRHEQPPPGYFHNFSRQVIVRIRAGEASGDPAWETLSWEAPWLQRLWAALEAKPIWAGAFGVAVCSLLISGALYSGNMEQRLVPVINLSATEPQGALADHQAGASTILGQAAAFASSYRGCGHGRRPAHAISGRPHRAGSLHISRW